MTVASFAILILYLSNSSLDSRICGWSSYGTGRGMETCEYTTAEDALVDGWQLVQLSPAAGSVGDDLPGYMRHEAILQRIWEAA
jgi:hypothetical protein